MSKESKEKNSERSNRFKQKRNEINQQIAEGKFKSYLIIDKFDTNSDGNGNGPIVDLESFNPTKDN